MKYLRIIAVLLLSPIVFAQSNPLENKGAGATVSAIHVLDVTPNDGCTVLVEPNRAIWVGAAGNLRVKTWAGETVTIVGIQDGSLLPLVIQCVLSTGTTATSIQVWW